MNKLETTLDRQYHNEQYPFILHWEQLPVCKESMDFIAQMVINSFKRILDEEGKR